MKRILVYGLILGVLTAPLSVAVAEPYRVSILPRYFPERLTAMMTPLIEYLEERLGANFELVLTEDFADYTQRIRRGDFTLGYQNPMVYTQVAERHQVIAMARKGEGGDRFRGIVITRPGNGIQRLDDLRGRRVLMVGKTSAGGFLSQKLSLRESGISIDTLELEQAAQNRQENVLIGVSIGDADAGFIRESARHVADRYIRPGSIATLTTTAWLPNWAFSVDRSIPTSLREQLTEAILDLSNAPEVQEALGLSGIQAAEDTDYDVVREALETH